MDTLEQDDSALWGELESDFESQENAPLAFNPGEPPARRRTPLVALQQAVFSGFLPMLVLCWVGALYSIQYWEPHMGVLVTMGCLALSFPVAGVLSVHLRGPRKHLATYAGLGFLAGGVGGLMGLLADLGQSQMTHRFSTRRAIDLLQDHLEAFLSWGHLGLTAIVGIVVALLLVRYQSRLPWLDGKESGRIRRGIAWFCLLLPLLTPGFFVLAGHIQDVQLDRLLDRASQNHTPFRAEAPEHFEEWKEMAERLGPNTSGEPSERTQEEFRLDEKRFLELASLQREKRTFISYSAQRVANILVLTPERLRHPIRVALVSIRFNQELSRYESSYGLSAAYDILFHHLQTSSDQGSSWEQLQGELRDTRINLQEDLGRMERYVGQGLLNDDHYRNRFLFEVLGLELKHSPERWFFMRERLAQVEWWLDFRAESAGLPPAKRLQKLRNQDFEQAPLARSLALQVYATDLRQILEAAEVLLACRRHLATQGQWPSSPEEVATLVDFEVQPNRWTFTLEGSSLKVQDNLLKAANRQPGPRLVKDPNPDSPRLPWQWVLR